MGKTMTRFSALTIFACLLAGCTAPSDSGTPQTTASTKHPNCEAPTGSHIVDLSNCGNDPFLRHGVIADRSGNPYQTEANNPGHP
jgi:hypothetical protein